MLTRGAAGAPDVHIPSRLVMSGPLLLSSPYAHTHTHVAHTEGLYIEPSQNGEKAASVAFA